MYGKVKDKSYFVARRRLKLNECQGRAKHLKSPVMFRGRQKNVHKSVTSSDQDATHLLTLFSSGISCQERVLGLIVFMGCMGLCIYQVYDRGFYYLSEPTSVDVVITRNESIIFPAISLCTLTSDFFEAMMYDMNTYTNSKYNWDELWDIPFEENGLDLNQLWKENAISASAVNVTITARSLTTYVKKTQDFPGFMTNFDTAYCNCITFKPEKKLEVKGKTIVNITIDHLNLPRRNVTHYVFTTYLYYYFHDADMSQIHEAMVYEDYMTGEDRVTLILKIKKFSYKKKIRFQCQDELEVHAQKTKCIDEAMRNANMSCRYPFVKYRTDLRPCVTLTEVWAASDRVYEIYDEENVVNCHQRKQICRETVYGYTTPTKEKTSGPRYTELIVIIPENIFQTVTESFTYSFAALLSDVGGSLGFFLGLSIITLFNALQDFTRQVTKILR